MKKIWLGIKIFGRNGKYRGIIFEQALYLATKSKSWLIVDELLKHIRLIKLRSVEDAMEPMKWNEMKWRGISSMERRQLNACFSPEWIFDLPSKRYTYDKYEAK